MTRELFSSPWGLVGCAILGAVAASSLWRLTVSYAGHIGTLRRFSDPARPHLAAPPVGIAMVLTTLSALSVASYFGVFSQWIVTTAAILAVVGYLDDRMLLSGADKLFFQLVCTGAVVLLDPGVRAALSAYGITGQLLAVAFVAMLVYAVDFIDEIDGLGLLVLSIAACGSVVYTHGSPAIQGYALVCAIVAGAIGALFCIAVFRASVQKPPTAIGSVGTYFFTYLLAVIHLSVPIATQDVFAKLSFTALCFLVPIADVTTTLLWRVYTGRSLFEPDKGRLHHRTLQVSLGRRTILGAFGLIGSLAVLIAAAIFEIRPSVSSTLPTLICVSLVGIISLLIILAELGARQRLQGYFARIDAGEPVYYFKYRITDAAGHALTAKHIKRLEARIGAEIRITDLCYAQDPYTLFLTLRTLPEPLQGISSRIESVFQSDPDSRAEAIEYGKLCKAPTHSQADLRKAS